MSKFATVECPHCGARNSTFMVYCGRCERPLRLDQETQIEGVPIFDEPDTLRDKVDFPESKTEPMNPSALFPSIPIPERLPDPKVREPQARVGSDWVDRNEEQTRLHTTPAPSSPKASAAPKKPSVPVVKPAASWRVVFSFIIDGAVLLALAAAVVAVELIITESSFRPTFRNPIDIAAEWLYQYPEPVMHGLLVAVGVGFLMGVNPWGRTVGRWMVGTVLVRSSGRRWSFWVTLLRAIGLAISIGTLGLGFLWAVVDPHRRSLHDIFAGTVTVRTRALP